MAIAGANTQARVNTESVRSTEIMPSNTEARPATLIARIKNVLKHPATVSLGMSLGSIQLFSGLVLGLGVLALALSGTVVVGLPVFAVMAAGLMVVGAVIIGLSAYGAYHCDNNRQQVAQQSEKSSTGEVISDSATTKIPRAQLKEVKDTDDLATITSSKDWGQQWISKRPESLSSVDTDSEDESILDDKSILGARGRIPFQPLVPPKLRYPIPRIVVPAKPESPSQDVVDRRDPAPARPGRVERPDIRFDRRRGSEAEQFLAYIQGSTLIPTPMSQTGITMDELLDLMSDPSKVEQISVQHRREMYQYIFPLFMKEENELDGKIGGFYFRDKESVATAASSLAVQQHLRRAALVVMKHYGFVPQQTVMDKEIFVPTSNAAGHSSFFKKWDLSHILVAQMLESLQLFGMDTLSDSIFTGITAHPHYENISSSDRERLMRRAYGLEDIKKEVVVGSPRELS